MKVITWTKDITSIIKGFAIILIVIGHADSKVRNAGFDHPLLLLCSPFGAIGVGLFLICSGYGLEKSYQKNGLKDFWKKKMIGILMPYSLIECVGLFFHPNITLLDFVLDITMLSPLHPFGWYMQYLLIWYIAFYFGSLMDEHQWAFLKQVGGGKFLLFIIIAIIIIFFWDSLRADQVLSFMTGFLMAKNPRLINKVVEKKTILVCIALLIPCLYLRFGKVLNHLIGTIAWNLFCLVYYFPFIILTLALMLRILGKRKTKILGTVGAYSYSIYLVHGYTFEMITTANAFGLLEFILLTVVFSIVFERVVRCLKNKLELIIS